MTASWLAKKSLNLLGFSTTDDGRVTEEELRLLVVGARDSGGIETEEAKVGALCCAVCTVRAVRAARAVSAVRAVRAVRDVCLYVCAFVSRA